MDHSFDLAVPRAGDGVTHLTYGSARPGTILRVSTSGRCFWDRRNELEGEPGKRTLEQLDDAVERLEPWLLKTRWYPMTYMAIPGLLERADEIIVELAAFRAKDEAGQARARALGERLTALRRGFKRRV